MLKQNLSSLYYALVNDGLICTIQLVVSRLIDVSFDWRYGTDTYRWVERDQLQVSNEQSRHSEPYKPTHSLPLRRVLASIDLLQPRVMVDYGCGKGRALFIAAEQAYAYAYGVEFSPLLVHIAKQNLRLFRRRSSSPTQIEIIQQDVRLHTLKGDENIFYIFNPFDAQVLSELIPTIDRSLQAKPRSAVLIYRAPQHHLCLNNSVMLHYEKTITIWGQSFNIYRHEPGSC